MDEIHDSDNPTTTVVADDPKGENKPEKSLISASYHLGIGDEDPTADELHGPNALRRVSAPIPWAVYTVAFVELCERFSYYGTQVLCMFDKHLSIELPLT
jgi:POT family proton-dependent oligopeptide transporter